MCSNMADEIGDLDGVGSATEEKIRSMGIDSLDDLARANPSLVDEYDVGLSESRLEGFIEEASSAAVIIQTGDEVVEEYNQRPAISTGIQSLDNKIGGWDARSLIAVGGGTGAGKTQLAFQALGNAVKESGGTPAVYIETEPDRYRGKRIEQMFDQSVQSKVHKVSVGGKDALDQQYRAYKAVHDSYDDVSMVVVDSFTSRFRLATEFDGRSNLGERNEEFSRHLGQLEEMATELDCPVLLNCQVYANPTQYGGSSVIYGSSLMMHIVNYVVMMKDRGGQLSEIRVQNHPEMGDFDLQVQITDNGMRDAE